jgi:hypothetical protein
MCTKTPLLNLIFSLITGIAAGGAVLAMADAQSFAAARCAALSIR